MEWIVRFKDVKGEARVEADDRWGAVVAAVKQLKLSMEISMSYWSDIASVHKAEKKKKKAWWERD